MTTTSGTGMEVDRAKPRRRRSSKMDVDVVASADDLFADEPQQEPPRVDETGGPGPDPGPCLVCQEIPLATGNARLILKPDSEPAILALKRRAAAALRLQHGVQVIFKESPPGEHACNGAVGVAVREVKARVTYLA